MKLFLALAALAALSTFASACGNSNTGYSCTMSSFSSMDCLQRIKDQKCADGGVVITTQPDGGPGSSCCTWVNCVEAPYEGAIGG